MFIHGLRWYIYMYVCVFGSAVASVGSHLKPHFPGFNMKLKDVAGKAVNTHIIWRAFKFFTMLVHFFECLWLRIWSGVVFSTQMCQFSRDDTVCAFVSPQFQFSLFFVLVMTNLALFDLAHLYIVWILISDSHHRPVPHLCML